MFISIADSKKVLGLRPDNFFSHFFFRGAPTLVQPCFTILVYIRGGLEKMLGPSARKLFLGKFVSWGADPGFAVGLGRRRKSRASAKISGVGENLGRRRKSRASAKISGVGENPGRRRKSRASAKISGVGENLRRRRKSRASANISGADAIST